MEYRTEQEVIQSWALALSIADHISIDDALAIVAEALSLEYDRLQEAVG